MVLEFLITVLVFVVPGLLAVGWDLLAELPQRRWSRAGH